MVSDFSVAHAFPGPGVTLLDPASGPGTFLEHASRIAGNRYSMIGLDCMLPAVALANARLSLAACDTRVAFGNYLGNSVAPFLENNISAGSILVILGNPPYSVSSSNKNDHIDRLMLDYKRDLKERNMQPLSDDYIKFIRFSQYLVEKNGRGIVAFVINNSFIYKVIHRVMRASLLRAFNKIIIINLHGNSNIVEKGPDGHADESVFDIKVGTSLVFLIRSETQVKDCNVLYHDLFGARKHKLAFLEGMRLDGVPFTPLAPVAPHYFMVPQDTRHEDEFQSYMSLKEIFVESVIGVKTHRDAFIVDFSPQGIKYKLEDIVGDISDDDFKRKYRLKDAVSLIKKYRASIKAEGIIEEKVVPYLYRPFDTRVIYYSPSVITRDRARVMRNMILENVALITTRLLSTNEFNHCLVTAIMGDIGVLSSRTSESAYFFPLHLIRDASSGGNARNLQPNFTQEFNAFFGYTYHGLELEPTQVLGYIYAILHSEKYRARFAESLKHDFPRIPFIKDAAGFNAISRLGCQLVDVHLSRAGHGREIPIHVHDPGVPVHVQNPRHERESKRLYVNKVDYLAG
nr:type ISP restriction/modification enzyme [Candidatus Sigynarchaeota archaeon]